MGRPWLFKPVLQTSVLCFIFDDENTIIISRYILIEYINYYRKRSAKFTNEISVITFSNCMNCDIGIINDQSFSLWKNVRMKVREKDFFCKGERFLRYCITFSSSWREFAFTITLALSNQLYLLRSLLVLKWGRWQCRGTQCSFSVAQCSRYYDTSRYLLYRATVRIFLKRNQDDLDFIQCN